MAASFCALGIEGNQHYLHERRFRDDLRRRRHGGFELPVRSMDATEDSESVRNSGLRCGSEQRTRKEVHGFGDE